MNKGVIEGNWQQWSILTDDELDQDELDQIEGRQELSGKIQERYKSREDVDREIAEWERTLQ